MNKIKILSNRLIEGIEEEGLNLAKLYIPGLSRYYIRKLLEAGYGDEESLKGVSEEDLSKIVPERLVKRIKKRLYINDQRLTTNSSCNPLLVTLPSPLQPETRNPKPVTVLEIDIHRPDRIIFEGKEVKVTATEFSLIYLLAQNRGKILTHNDLLGTIWKENKYATYPQITYHLYKTRRVILKTIGNNKKNKEKVKDILKVVSRRGIMLNLEEDKLKIN